MSEWLDRLRQIGEDDAPKEENLAPRLTSVVPKIKSPLEFMSTPPDSFREFVPSYGEAEFNKVTEDAEMISYMTTLTENGTIVDWCRVDIYRNFNSKILRHYKARYNLTLVDEVIIWHPAFFSKALRQCEIAMWAAKALTQYCGFRFY